MIFFKPVKYKLELADVISAAMCLLLSLYILAISKSWIDASYGGDKGFARDYIEGLTKKPYVYRALVPSIVKILISVLPQSIIPIQVILGIMFLSLFGYALGLYLLGRKFFPGSIFVPCLAAIIGLSLLPPIINWKIKPYDFTELMLVTFSLYAMACGRFRLYMVLFAATTLNKETSIFLTVFFSVWYFNKLDKKIYFVFVLLQILLYGEIKLALNYAFSSNSGGYLYLSHKQVSQYLDGYSLQSLLNIVFGLFLVAYRYWEKPLFLRMSLLTVFSILYPSYLFFGIQSEYRVFVEIFPQIALLSAHTVIEFFGLNFKRDSGHSSLSNFPKNVE